MIINKLMIRIAALGILSLGAQFISVTARAEQVDRNLGIIPAPLSVTSLPGEFRIIVDDDVAIVFGSASAHKEANLFRDYLYRAYGLDVPVVGKRDAEPGKPSLSRPIAIFPIRKVIL